MSRIRAWRKERGHSCWMFRIEGGVDKLMKARLLFHPVQAEQKAFKTFNNGKYSGVASHLSLQNEESRKADQSKQEAYIMNREMSSNSIQEPPILETEVRNVFQCKQGRQREQMTSKGNNNGI